MRKARKPEVFLPAWRPQELRDRAEGYLDLCLDLLFARPPAYEEVSWEDALRDLEAHLGRAIVVLEEPVLAEVE